MNSQDTNPITRPFTRELEGYWKTEGYNYFLEIKEGNYIVHEYTQVSCLTIKGFMGYLDPTAPTFIARINDKKNLVCENLGTTFYIESKRIPELPEFHQSTKLSEPDNPEMNFEVFWHTLNELYPFFEQRKIDWREIHDTYRSKVTNETSREELAYLLREMVNPLNDAHMFLKAKETDTIDILVVFPQWARGPIKNALNAIEENAALGKWKGAEGKVASVLNETFQDFLPVIKQKYLHGNFKTACNEMIFYGKVSETIGYIYLARVFNYASDVKHESLKEIETFNKAFDSIIDEFDTMESIILDIRFCLGGDDSIGLAVTERFADKKRMVLAKRAKGAEGLSPPREFFVDPSGKKTFARKKIFILTSGVTISGGENLAIMMKALPNTTFIGESGPGILSDTIVRHLPNGWQFFLPMEVFYGHDGKAYETQPFPIDVKVPLNKDHFQQQKDDILEKAIELVKKS